MKARRPVWRLLCLSKDQGGSGEKWFDSRYVLKVEPVGFAEDGEGGSVGRGESRERPGCLD